MQLKRTKCSPIYTLCLSAGSTKQSFYIVSIRRKLSPRKKPLCPSLTSPPGIQRRQDLEDFSYRFTQGKMCTCKYGGFACGHSHPAGTSLSIERCDSSELCSLISFGLQRNGQRHCPDCQRVLNKLYVVWKAQREEWTRTETVPEAEIKRVSGAIIRSFADHCRRLIPSQGPSHRAQEKYGAIQERLLVETSRFAEELRRAGVRRERREYIQPRRLGMKLSSVWV